MLIAFANNQVMVAPVGGTVEIFTDPVPMGDFDRASVMLNVHYLFVAATVTYQAQASNDGTNWVDVPLLTDNAAAVTPVPRQEVRPVNGAFIRFRYTFNNAGVDTAGVCFDLHVLLDHV